jgi:hypothetical protein
MGKLVISLFLFLAAAGPALAQAAATKPPATAPSTSASASSAQFHTEAAAKAHCPGDTVVWATLSRSHVYHLSGDRYYGKTRRGAFMCQKDADAAGMHQSSRRMTTSSAPSSKAPSGSTTK